MPKDKKSRESQSAGQVQVVVVQEAGETESEREEDDGSENQRRDMASCSSFLPFLKSSYTQLLPVNYASMVQYMHTFSVASQSSSSNFSNIPSKNQLPQQIILKFHSHSESEKFCFTTFPLRISFWKA